MLAAAVICLVWSLAPLRAAGQTINVSVTCSANGDINPKGSLTLPANSDLDVTATPDVGYLIEDWYLNGDHAGWGDTHQRHFAFGDMDVSIHVNFQRITNYVTVTPEGAGDVSPGGIGLPALAVAWGDSITFTAAPDAHYHVATWAVDSAFAQTGGTTFTLPAVQADHSVRVVFEPDIYQVQAGAGPHGGISPTGAVSIVYYESQSFTATPDTGWEVDAWLLDGQAVQTGGATFSVNHIETNHALQVTFVETNVPSPTLTIQSSPTKSLILSWPLPADGWVLEWTNRLADVSGPWPQISPPYETNAEQAWIVVPAQTGNRFYRLHRP